jgi:hypothetical protein
MHVPVRIPQLMGGQFMVKDRQGHHMDPNLLRIAQRLIVDLARISGAVPSSLLIKGVVLASNTAVTGGAYAEIYRGRLDDRDIALKKLRVYENRDCSDIHRVCIGKFIMSYLPNLILCR